MPESQDRTARGHNLPRPLFAINTEVIHRGHAYMEDPPRFHVVARIVREDSRGSSCSYECRQVTKNAVGVLASVTLHFNEGELVEAPTMNGLAPKETHLHKVG